MGWLAVLAVAQVVTTLVQRESAVVAQRDKVILDTVLVQVAAVAALALLLLVSMEALARQIASQEPR
jgi:predicted ATPase